MAAAEVIARVYRGRTVESEHYGAAVVVDADGRVIASLGDPDFITYSRSALKPLQATPTIARGAVEKFGLAVRHVAVICGSHSGEERHVNAVQEILTAINCDERDLNCGVHVPYIYRMQNQTPPVTARFNQLHNNCSGKQSGMLALCRLLRVPTAGYLHFDHPAQRVIKELVLRVVGLAGVAVGTGIDGCSAPNYAIPLSALARGYANLAGGHGPDEATSQAMATIVEAMRTEPAMVSGWKRYDLALAELAGDRLVCKVGGEAIECVALTDRGWGIAVKVADGGARALAVVMTEILRQLDVLTEDEVDKLRSFARPRLLNHRRIIIGGIRPVVRLKR